MNELKIIWHSVASFIRSGYGKVTRYITQGIKQAGYDIIVSCYYGIEPGGVLNINGVPHVSAKRGQFGELDYKYYFQSTRRNLGILMTDFWAFGWFPNIRLSCSSSPLDHEDYPPELQEYIKSYDYIVSLSKWTKKELEKFGCKSTWIPHGVNLNIFKPMNKERCKEIVGIPNDRFIIGTVAANSDKETRKSWYEMLDALKMFLDNNPDVKDILHVIHTNPLDPRGINLQLAIKKRGLENICKLENPFMSNVGISEEELAMLYNTFDIFLCPSKREGFGLCFYEAMACGVPCIGHDFSAMTEAIKGHGWLAKTAVKITTPINAVTGIPDVKSIEKCIYEAYFNDSLREKYSKKCRRFSLKYSWDFAINKWIEFLEQIESSLPLKRGMVGISKEKDKLWNEIQKK
jgi:glycosyltransferase involved in cell wall biosynthesis